jgi:DNA-binding NarL/FixJ family response regulator
MTSRQTLLIADGTSPRPYPVGSIAVLKSGMVETLEEREELVLRLRFGSGRTVQTQPEIARLLGVSDSTVRHIERQALRKLRLSALGPVGKGWSGWDEV